LGGGGGEDISKLDVTFKWPAYCNEETEK
jgi:hypothetical protein